MSFRKILTEDISLATHSMMTVPSANFFGNKLASADYGGAVTKAELLELLELDKRILTPVALGTWTGSSNLTTAGTITTGTWQATPLAVTYGGTGANLSGTANANNVLYASSANVYGYLAGSANRYLVKKAGSALAFDYLDLSTMTAGVLPISKGGTGISSLTVGSYIAVSSSAFALSTASAIKTAIETASHNSTVSSSHNHDTTFLKKASAPSESLITGDLFFDCNQLKNFSLYNNTVAPTANALGQMYMNSGYLYVNLN